MLAPPPPPPPTGLAGEGNLGAGFARWSPTRSLVACQAGRLVCSWRLVVWGGERRERGGGIRRYLVLESRSLEPRTSRPTGTEREREGGGRGSLMVARADANERPVWPEKGCAGRLWRRLPADQLERPSSPSLGPVSLRSAFHSSRFTCCLVAPIAACRLASLQLPKRESRRANIYSPPFE